MGWGMRMAERFERVRRRQLLAVFALVLAALAQYLLAQNNRVGGLLLFAMAVPILVIALAEQPLSKGAVSQQESGARWRGQWSRARLRLTLSAMGCNVAALYLLGQDNTSLLGLLLWLASLGLVTLAAPVSETVHGVGQMSTLSVSKGATLQDSHPSTGSGCSDTSARCLEIALVVLGLLLAAFLRVYRIHELPPGIFIDETNAAIDALKILDGERVSPFATGWAETPTLYVYYMAGLFRLMGVSFFALKLVSILPGLLTVASVYPLAVRLSPSAALRTGAHKARRAFGPAGHRNSTGAATMAAPCERASPAAGHSPPCSRIVMHPPVVVRQVQLRGPVHLPEPVEVLMQVGEVRPQHLPVVGVVARGTRPEAAGKQCQCARGQ